MKPLKKLLSLLLIVVLLLPGTALAAPEEELPETPPERITSVSAFVSDPEKQAYIDRMISYYIASETGVHEALEQGMAVMMLFEGGSDYPLTQTVRTGAVCLVLRYDETSSPYIAACLPDCSTLPDYPLYYAYGNGHTGYGTATLLDGVYPLYTVNHHSTYAGFNVRNGSAACAPCLYCREDGSFSVVNGLGINVHTRNGQTVSGWEGNPRSAGCLTLSKPPYDDYLALVKAMAPDVCTYAPATYSDYDIQCYETGEDQYAGMLVVDRYLAKSELLSIYESREAVERITAFSTVRQADALCQLSGYTFYPTYLTAEVDPSGCLYDFPSLLGEPLPLTDSSVTVTGLWQSLTGEVWYASDEGFFPAESVLSLTPRTDDCSIHSENYPTVKELGKSFSLEGIVAGGYNRVLSVTGSLLASDGTVESTVTVENTKASLALDASDYVTSYYDSLDYGLAFGKLPVGTHTYVVIANVRSWYGQEGALRYTDLAVPVLEKEFSVVPRITFDSLGGSSVSSELTEADGRLGTIPQPEMEGYRFLGWYTADGEAVTADTVFTESCTVTARWSEIFVSPRTYDDVPEGCWYGEAVAYVSAESLMNGVSETSFSPNTAMTRAMFATILYRLEGSPEVTAPCPFTDVKPGSWQEAGVVWASQVGLMEGYDREHVGPDDPITREQIAALLFRYASYKGYDLTGAEDLLYASFPDSSTLSSYAEVPVSWAVRQGLIGGMEDGTLQPRGTATRAQAAVLLQRMHEKF